MEYFAQNGTSGARRLSVFVPTKFNVEVLTHTFLHLRDGIRKWGLWEVISS